VKSVTVISEDKVGLLADISYVLAKSKINIDAINVSVISDKAVIAMEVSNPEKSKQVLEAAGYRVETNSLVVKMTHAELESLAERLLKEGVKVEKTNTLTKDDKCAVVALLVDKPKRATTLLQKNLIFHEGND
jgi:hypothetical protein